jgi:hypothetical protein
MKKINKIIILFMSVGLPAIAFSAQLVDPTRPPSSMTAADAEQHATGPLTLFAIFSYSGRALAIINQQTVTVGDEIGDFSVTSIHENTVELINKDQKQLILELAPKVKRPE